MILHVDMDAFYASVEERDRPELVGKPVIVGGSREGRGVVSAANYVARKYGVHSALPMVTALRYCPRAIVLPVRMDHYAAISRQIREIFHRYTPLVEPLSLDEAFLDARGSEKLFGSAAEIGRKIQSDIWNETRLVASIGVAPNKFLAKIASDLKKPNGFVEVLRSCLLDLTEQVARRLRRHKLFGKTIHLKVRYNDFRTISRAHSLPSPSHSTAEIWDAVSEHLLTRVDLQAQPVRLIGIGLSSLAKNRERQKTLFDDHSERDSEIDSTTDAIKEKFGGAAIQRGSTFSAKRKVNDDHGIT